jgi:hypothetical protein
MVVASLSSSGTKTWLNSTAKKEAGRDAWLPLSKGSNEPCVPSVSDEYHPMILVSRLSTQRHAHHFLGAQPARTRKQPMCSSIFTRPTPGSIQESVSRTMQSPHGSAHLVSWFLTSSSMKRGPYFPESIRVYLETHPLASKYSCCSSTTSRFLTQTSSSLPTLRLQFLPGWSPSLATSLGSQDRDMGKSWTSLQRPQLYPLPSKTLLACFCSAVSQRDVDQNPDHIHERQVYVPIFRQQAIVIPRSRPSRLYIWTLLSLWPPLFPWSPKDHPSLSHVRAVQLNTSFWSNARCVRARRASYLEKETTLLQENGVIMTGPIIYKGKGSRLGFTASLPAMAYSWISQPYK